MGKVQYIKKSRKQWKCGKCGSVIEVGSPYYKGEINFGPTFVRCCRCGLQPWEVTTSEYTLQVGQLVNTWCENHEADESGIEGIVDELTEIRDGCQERLDNIPESLQEAEAGTLLQERIDALDEAIDDMENICVEDLQEEVVSEMQSEIADACAEANDIDEDEAADGIENMDWEQLMESDDIPEHIKERMREALDEKVHDAIDEVLGSLDY